MKFYPVSTWNNLPGAIVRLAFGYDTIEEAEEAGKKAENEYKDQTFTGKIIEASNCNSFEIAAKDFLNH